MLIRPLLLAQERERKLILGELAKVRGLMPLLMRQRNGGNWTRAERLQLMDQLAALANISPYLFVLAMPGSFAFLPLLAWWIDRRRQRRMLEAVPSSRPNRD